MPGTCRYLPGVLLVDRFAGICSIIGRFWALSGYFGRFLGKWETVWHFSAFHDKVLEAVNFRALAEKKQLTILESKEAISRES